MGKRQIGELLSRLRVLLEKSERKGERGVCEGEGDVQGQGSAGRSGLPIMGCGQAEAELPVGRDAAWGLRDPDGGLNLMLCQIPLIHDSETAVFCVSHWVVLTEKRSGRRSRNSFVTPPPIVPCALQVASFEHTPRITGWEQRVVQQPR